MYECMRERMGAADWCVAAPRTVRFRFQTDNWLKVLSTSGLFLAVNGRKRVYLFLHLFIDTHSAAFVIYLLNSPISIY